MKISKDGTKLFVITSELSKGAKISNNEQNNVILIYPDGRVIRFDQRIRTKDGWVSGVEAFSVREDGRELAHLCQGDKVVSAKQQAKPKLTNPVPEKEKQSKSEPVNEHHKQLEHPNLVMTRSTEKSWDVSLTGTADICNDGAVGKARQEKCPKPLSRELL